MRSLFLSRDDLRVRQVTVYPQLAQAMTDSKVYLPFDKSPDYDCLWF